MLLLSKMSSTILDRATEFVQWTKKWRKNMGIESSLADTIDRVCFSSFLGTTNSYFAIIVYRMQVCRRVNKSGISKTKIGLCATTFISSFDTPIVCISGMRLFTSPMHCHREVFFLSIFMYLYCLYQIFIELFSFSRMQYIPKITSYPREEFN